MYTSKVHYGSGWVEDIPANQISQWLTRKEVLVWIDVAEPDEADFVLLREQFRFHPLVIEDTQSPQQRPKVDLYQDYAFIVVYALSNEADWSSVTLQQISLFVGVNYVVTVHQQPVEALSEVYDRWQDPANPGSDDLGSLLYAILDTLLDDYFPALDRMAERLDMLEAEIFQRYHPSILKELLRMKRHLLAMRRIVGPQRDVFNRLIRGEAQFLPEESLPYWQDLYDHSIRVVESVDLYREMITAVADGFLTLQSNNINVVMQRLTIINLLFLPLAVLTGFFGMNFEMLPFDNAYVLQGALIAMLLLPATMMLWLRHKGWG